MEHGGCRRFSIREIRSSTKNLSPQLLLGQGGYGKVYKGTIGGPAARTVAIKVFESNSGLGEEGFRTEIQVLSDIKHEHVVSLIGYCADGEERALVYEYMPHGSLSDHLHGHNHKSQILSWELRLKASIGAAHGLDYLHSRHRVSLVHRDVKSSNILLDEDWVGKIADFGISKLITGSGRDGDSFGHVTTELRGTVGYMDPGYFRTLKLTRSSDVYSFGVLLFEVLSGRKPVSMNMEREMVHLVEWASRCINEGKVHKLIDEKLVGEISPPCLDVFVKIARRCISPTPKDRPSMADVVKDLELAMNLQCGYNPNKERKDNDLVLISESIVVNEGDRAQFDDGDDYFHQEFKNCSTKIREERGFIAISVIVLWNAMILCRLRSRIWDRIMSVVALASVLFHRLWQIWEVKFKKDDDEIKLSSRAMRVCRCFSLAEIRTATRNFDDGLVIGKGGFGKVYKGVVVIDHGKVKETVSVAIKRLHSHSKQGVREFRREIETISELQHVNIISLIGYCKENKEFILVYEHMPNGSLADHLYKLAFIGDAFSPLSWKQRLEICFAAARGLDYLHTGRGVIHRDVKASNILLGEDFVPKLSDFGLAKPEKMNNPEEIGMSATKGTFGYFDPDYLRTYIPTRKSDTYAFGVVLLEVLSGKPGADKRLAVNPRDRYLTLWVQDKIEKGQVDEIVDTSLERDITPDTLKAFLDIAQRCLEDEPNKRPTMAQVVLELESLLHLEEKIQSQISYDETTTVISISTEQFTKSSIEDSIYPSKEETSRRMALSPQSQKEKDKGKRRNLKQSLRRLRNKFFCTEAIEL